MEKISLKKIMSVLNQAYSGEEKLIDSICTDSRRITKGCLFIALVGESFDGHDYVAYALEQGAEVAIVSDKNRTYPPNVYIVDDTRQSLLKIAGIYRRERDCKVVAITGSVGKTTTKEMVALVLETQFETIKTAANLNNEIGLAQMIFQIESQHKAAAFELGVDGPNQMKPMSEAANPDIAIVTNIGVSHLEAFGTRENIYKEKISIGYAKKENGYMIVCGDDEFLSKVERNETTIFYGINNKSVDIIAENITQQGENTYFDILWEGKKLNVALPILGKHNVYNALAAFGAGILSGVSPEKIISALKTYSPVGMRQRTVNFAGMIVVEDCYNSSPPSLNAAMETLKSMEVSGKKIAVISDMLELGSTEKEQHYTCGEHISLQGIDFLFTCGELSKELTKGAKSGGLRNAYWFDSQEELFDKLKETAKKGDIVWFKASRGMKLENVIEKLYEECGEK